MDACALNCGHDATLLNVRVAEVEMGRPLVQVKVSSVHVQVEHCMWSFMEEIFLKPTGQMTHTTGSYMMCNCAAIFIVFLQTVKFLMCNACVHGCVLVVVITSCGSG